MIHDVPNPEYEPAIPHGILRIAKLLKVVIFGVPGGCLRAVSGVGPKSPSGDRFRDAYETFGNQFSVRR